MSGSSACTWHTILCKNCQVWFPYFDVFATYPCETSDIFFTSNIIYRAARLIFFSENKWQSVTLSNWSTDWSSSFHALQFRNKFIFIHLICFTGSKPLICDKRLLDTTATPRMCNLPQEAPILNNPFFGSPQIQGLAFHVL